MDMRKRNILFKKKNKFYIDAQCDKTIYEINGTFPMDYIPTTFFTLSCDHLKMVTRPDASFHAERMS